MLAAQQTPHRNQIRRLSGVGAMTPLVCFLYLLAGACGRQRRNFVKGVAGTTTPATNPIPHMLLFSLLDHDYKISWAVKVHLMTSDELERLQQCGGELRCAICLGPYEVNESLRELW